MHFLIIGDDATEDDLKQAIVQLRDKQRRACIASTRAEIGEDIDEALDLLSERYAVGSEPAL